MPQPTRYVLLSLVVGAAWCGTWTIRNPLPTPNAITGLAAVDARLLYVCGYAGQLFRSDDGGVTWAARNLPTLADLSGLAVIGRDTIYTAGHAGTLARSVDGGASWKIWKRDSDTRFKSIAAPDGRTAFAVGNKGAIFRTRDGGGTWDSSNCGSDRWLASVAAADRSHAWFAGGDTVYRTADGGNTWTPHWVGGIAVGETVGLVSLSAVDADTVFAAAQGNRNSAQFRAVYRTVDGGLSWNRIDTAYGAIPYSISAVDGSTAFVGCFAGELRTTHTAGGAWTNSKAGYQGLGSFQSFLAIAALDSRTAFATGDQATVYATVDGGETWTQKNPVSHPSLRSLAITEAGVAFAGGANTVILKSVDRGLHWATSKAPVSYGATLAGIATRDGKYVMAVGFDRVFLSEDGGESWANGTLPFGPTITMYLRALALGGGDTAFAAGDSGVIVRSVDRGRNWEIMASGTRASLFTLAMAGPRSLLAAGDSGVLLRSVDGGTEWTRMKADLGRRVSCLHFLDAQTGFAALDSGRVGRTKDGGATWAFAGVYARWDPVHFVHAIDANTVFAGGYHGAMMRSEDGGATWVRDTTRVAYDDLYAVAHGDPGTVLAVGDFGIILSRGTDPAGLRPGAPRRMAAGADAPRLWRSIPGGGRIPGSGLRTLQGRNVQRRPSAGSDRAGIGSGVYVGE